MLHTKFRFIWPSGFRGIIFFRNRPIRNNFYFFLLLSAKLEIVVPGSGIRYFIFKISGKPSFIEAVLWNYDSLCSFSTFFALNFDKKLAVE